MKKPDPWKRRGTRGKERKKKKEKRRKIPSVSAYFRANIMFRTILNCLFYLQCVGMC
jgi:hypothetical protein